jgi:hypothetical protein
MSDKDPKIEETYVERFAREVREAGRIRRTSPMLFWSLLLAAMVFGVGYVVKEFGIHRGEKGPRQNPPEDITKAGSSPRSPSTQDIITPKINREPIVKTSTIPVTCWTVSESVAGVRVAGSPYHDQRDKFAVLVGGAIDVKIGGQKAKSFGPRGNDPRDWTYKLGEGNLFIANLSQGDSFVAETTEALLTFRLTKLPPLDMVTKGPRFGQFTTDKPGEFKITIEQR